MATPKTYHLHFIVAEEYHEYLPSKFQAIPSSLYFHFILRQPVSIGHLAYSDTNISSRDAGLE